MNQIFVAKKTDNVGNNLSTIKKKQKKNGKF